MMVVVRECPRGEDQDQEDRIDMSDCSHPGDRVPTGRGSSSMGPRDPEASRLEIGVGEILPDLPIIG